jgi:hypothetical protein
MNARKVQIDFDEATPVSPANLHFMPSGGARSADINEMNLNPKPGPTVAGAIREEAARLNLFLAAADSLSRQAHPIRWGINE